MGMHHPTQDAQKLTRLLTSTALAGFSLERLATAFMNNPG